MYAIKNIKVSPLSLKDISREIIRKSYKGGHIIGIVYSPSVFLHKRKRFRKGGLSCEKVFGFLHICYNSACYFTLGFNKNPIASHICIKCAKLKRLNFKRKYRIGSIFFNFPIINPSEFKNFIKILKLFKIIKDIKNLDIKHLFDSEEDIDINIEKDESIEHCVMTKKFLNFISIINKIITTLEVFKFKLIKIKKYNKLLHKDKLTIINYFTDNITSIKKIFIILFPVLPPILREFSLNNRKISITHELTSIYKLIINCNNRVLNYRGYFSYNIKNIISLHMLIGILLDKASLKAILKRNKTIYEKLSGKHGLFRQNLLGFRVDYSGRTVIVPGPYLSLKYIGLPFDIVTDIINNKFNSEMGYDELYEDIINESLVYNYNAFEKFLYVDYLDEYSVITNRAPTLHKMNIQSFCPFFVEGKAIKLSILSCTGYNADFDGDQMGIFTILEESSMLESLYMMKSLVNLYSPTTLKNIFNVSQGLISGSYILLFYNFFNYFKNYIIENYFSLIELHYSKNILINYPVFLKFFNYFYLTTPGRILVNFNIKK